MKWFKSYLTGRSQVCDVEGTLSESKEATCGVPQGSILGPLLFLIYVNDMSAAVKSRLLLYADDSVLLVSGKDVKVIEQTLSRELESVRDWLIDNKLSLHLGKTESILFGSKKKLKRANKISVQCSGSILESKTSVTYLGLIYI